MNKLLSTVFAVALAALPIAAQDHSHGALQATAGVAGNWQISVESPHGLLHGNFKLSQDGTKITGTCDIENIGGFDITGKMDGDSVSLDLKARGADMAITLNGKMEHDKLSGSMTHGGAQAGAWSAVRP